jgi:membrane protein YqaA with SNARE-associated domain
MSDLAAYAGLFLTALFAATLLPLQSEATLVALAYTGDYSIVALIAVASIGNTLGSVINWLLGRGIERFRDRKWFPIKAAALDRAQRWYQRYGKWSLLLSWAPVIGDPLTIIAGVLRERLPIFVLLVGLAKTARFVVVVAVALNIL